MLKLLKKLSNEKKNVCIHTNLDDTTKFIYGRILCVDKSFFVVYTFSCDGDFDGILLKKIDDIIFIETDNQYVEKMQKLSSPVLDDFKYEIDKEKIIDSVLKFSLETKRIVSIELVESGFEDVVGFVKKVDDEMCMIEQVDSYGIEDGISYIRKTDISQISYDSKAEVRILKIYKQRHDKRQSGDGSVNQGTVL